MFAYLLNDETEPVLDRARLRFSRSASAPLSPEIHRRFEARFGIPIIETMGLTETGAQILSNPMPPQERKIGSPGIAVGNEIIIADENLLKILIGLRKKVADKAEVPPYTVFQENSLTEMSFKYPISLEELKNINGVGEGKAVKYGQDFLITIKSYVDENEILRADDLIVKSTGANSALKLYMIQNVDRKLPLDDIAAAKGMNMIKFVEEMETIVFSGTKLNISYWIDELLDEDQQEELHEYFMEAESDDIALAIEEFDGEYEEEDIRLYRIKFMSDVAN